MMVIQATKSSGSGQIKISAYLSIFLFQGNTAEKIDFVMFDDGN